MLPGHRMYTVTVKGFQDRSSVEKRYLKIKPHD